MFKKTGKALLDFLGTVLIGLSIAHASPLAAETDMTRVASGGRVEINAHGVCRRVLNGTVTDAMIPYRSAAEWSEGGSAFLQNVPTGMTAYACVSPEIALRRWSRPGPVGNTGQPFQVNGTDHQLTFTSVGVSGLGVIPALSANRISYTPAPSTWSMEQLDEVTDTVPFEAIDAEGIPVSGTLRITLVGYQETQAYIIFRLYDPDRATTYVYKDFNNATDQLTGAGNLISILYRVTPNLFNGEFSTWGVVSNQYKIGHTFVIDNSPASMGAYSGPAVGDVNGDGSSNTILDAQIQAGLDYMERMVLNTQESVGTIRLEGVDDPNRDYLYVTQYGEGLSAPGVVGSGVEPMWVYTANATLSFVGQSDVSTYSSYRSSIRTALRSIRASGSNLNAAQVFNSLNGIAGIFYAKQFSAAIHFLSPGVNTGSAPNVAPFNGTGTGQHGTPIFAHYTGSNAGSSQASFMATLDHAGTVRRLSTPSAILTSEPPRPVTVTMVPAYFSNGSYLAFKDDLGQSISMDMRETSLARATSFSFLSFPASGTVCQQINCRASGITPNIARNADVFDEANGVFNSMRVYPQITKNPIYRAHFDINQDLLNNGSGSIYYGGYLNVYGRYTPTPP